MAKSVAVKQLQGANETAWFTCGLSAMQARYLTTVRQLLGAYQHAGGFEQRQIDIGWTFNGAGFARQAIAQRRVQFSTGEWVSHPAHLKSGPDRIGTAARGHHLIVCRDKRWTHDAGLFQATAAAVALLQVADERPVFERKREHRLKWKLERTSKILAQMTVDSMGL